jgi:hypothetical protein
MDPRVVQEGVAQTSRDAKALYEAGTDLVQWLGPSGSIVRAVHGYGFTIIGGRGSIGNTLGRHAGVAFRADRPCVVHAQRTEREVTLGLQNLALGASLVTGISLEAQREYRTGDRTDEYGNHMPGVRNAVAGVFEAAAAGVKFGVQRSLASVGRGVSQMTAPTKYTILSVWPEHDFGGRQVRIGPQFTAGELAAAFARLAPGL